MQTEQITEQTQEPAVAQETGAQDEPESYGLWTEDDGGGGADGAEVASPAAEPPKVDEKLEKSWTAVAEKENVLRRRDRELRAREKEIQEYQQLRETAKKEPWKAASALGISFDDLIDSIPDSAGESGSKQQPRTPAEVEELRREIAELKQAQQQEYVRRSQQSLASAVAHEMEARAGQYPTLASMRDQGAVQEVVKAIMIEAEETGRYPQIEDVFQRAEQQYASWLDQQWEMLSRHPRYASRAAGNGSATQVRQDATPRRSGSTLTNELAGEHATRRERPLTDEEIEADVLRDLRERGWVRDEE